MPITDEIIPDKPSSKSDREHTPERSRKNNKSARRKHKRRRVQLKLEEADILSNAQTNLVGVENNVDNESDGDINEHYDVCKRIHWKRLCVVVLVVLIAFFALYMCRYKLQNTFIPLKLPFSFGTSSTSSAVVGGENNTSPISVPLTTALSSLPVIHSSETDNTSVKQSTNDCANGGETLFT